MRNRISLIPIAALMLGACGDKTPKSSDANAAEVSNDRTGNPGVARPPAVATGPVSFADAQTAFKEKRYDEAARCSRRTAPLQARQHLGLLHARPVGVEAGRP